jgi:predicted nucleotidyltransferase
LDTKHYETRKDIDEPIIKAYTYGSVVYKCTTNTSDIDFIVVVESKDDNLYYSVNNSEGDYTVYSEQMFIKKIREHRISALECIFQAEDDQFLDYFHVVPELLRREISAVSSNSFVKCKKKLAIGEDYIGKKSMFHSLRILMFGIQIAKYGKIVDFTEANHLLPIIMDMKDWNEIKEYCQPIFNSLKSEFKTLAPLESDK